MTSNNSHFNSLVKLLLPQEIFDYFSITKLETSEREIHVFLEEFNIHPSCYQNEKLHSKGFHSESIIQDFPLRDKAMFLHVKRRKWLVQSSGEIVSRNWQTVAEGTRLTKDFATFLKGVLGYSSNP